MITTVPSRRKSGNAASDVSKASKVSTVLEDFNWLEGLAKDEHWYVRQDEIKDVQEIKVEADGTAINKLKWRAMVCAGKFVKVPKRQQSLFGSKSKESNVADDLPKLEDLATEEENSQMLSRLNDFGREIAVMSSLRHPNLVMFLGACFYKNNAPMIILEWCDGGSLLHRLEDVAAKTKKLSKTERMRILYEVALAGTYLHACSEVVVHGNIRPRNIMLDKDGVTKLGDFELSCFVQRNSASVNKQAEKPDSFRYMSPELFATKEYLTPVDVYSFAMIAYYTLTGVKPFESVTDFTEDFVTQIADKNQRPNLNLVKNAKMKKMIEKCWDSTPENRLKFSEILELFPKPKN